MPRWRSECGRDARGEVGDHVRADCAPPADWLVVPDVARVELRPVDLGAADAGGQHAQLYRAREVGPQLGLSRWIRGL
jgi:hypothetical protein